MKKVFVINGEAGCGKDTFVELCQKLTDKTVIWNVSMVDKVKEIAKACGWDGVKTPEARKFLSDLKDLCDGFNQMSYRSIEESIDRFYKDENAKILFIHAREPKDIERICDEFGACSLLVTRDGYRTQASNHADANVYNFDYDYHITNPGDSLSNYEKKAELFLDNIKVLHPLDAIKEKEIALEAFNLYEQMEAIDTGGIAPVIDNIIVRLDQEEHVVNIDYTYKEECGLSDCHYHVDTTMRTAQYDFSDGMIKRNGKAVFDNPFTEESKALQEEFFTKYKDFFPKTYEEYQKQKELDMENQEYEEESR